MQMEHVHRELVDERKRMGALTSLASTSGASLAAYDFGPPRSPPQALTQSSILERTIAGNGDSSRSSATTFTFGGGWVHTDCHVPAWVPPSLPSLKPSLPSFLPSLCSVACHAPWCECRRQWRGVGLGPGETPADSTAEGGRGRPFATTTVRGMSCMSRRLAHLVQIWHQLMLVCGCHVLRWRRQGMH